MWLDKQVSLYAHHADNIGRAMSLRSVLLTQFERDLSTIIRLKNLNRNAPDYKQRKLQLKNSLQCFTPAALLVSKQKGCLQEISRTGLLQLDFDHQDIYEYDVEELKQCVFQLQFIAFCGLSCSGDGFYALALISEPERLADYAQHCFDVLFQHGIKVDTSKGKKVENLRYLSYDANMLIRHNPEPLHIRHFKSKPAPKAFFQPYPYHTDSFDGSTLIAKELKALSEVRAGNRWATVQKVGYTLGGLQQEALLAQIKDCICLNPAFAGEEHKYFKCAEDCFNAGTKKPI